MMFRLGTHFVQYALLHTVPRIMVVNASDMHCGYDGAECGTVSKTASRTRPILSLRLTCTQSMSVIASLNMLMTLISLCRQLIRTRVKRRLTICKRGRAEIILN